MSQDFDAIYERGVFRPLEPIDLAEQTKVHLQIQDAAQGSMTPVADEGSAQNATLRDLLNWVDGRPGVSTDESVSARDHDRVLYGWQK